MDMLTPVVEEQPPSSRKTAADMHYSEPCNDVSRAVSAVVRPDYYRQTSRTDPRP